MKASRKALKQSYNQSFQERVNQLIEHFDVIG